MGLNATCTCQTLDHLKNDRRFVYSYKKFSDSLQVEPPDFNLIEVEFRIWYFNWSDGSDKLFQIKKLKDGNWVGQERGFYFYNDQNKNFAGEFKRIELGQNWPSAWDKIVSLGYLNLKTQDRIKIPKDPSLEFLVVADGESYTFEVITQRKKRKFSYNNPHSYYAFYLERGVEINEYKHMVACIDLLKPVLGF